MKVYMVEMVIPYWLQCNKCRKWRQLPRSCGELTTEITESWVCTDGVRMPKKVRYALHSCSENTYNLSVVSNSPQWRV